MNNDHRNDFSTKKFQQGGQWPDISNQLFDASVQRCYFFGQLSWAVMVFAGILYGISYEAKHHGFQNIGEYSAKLYACVMTLSFAIAVLGLIGGGRALKFSHSLHSQSQGNDRRHVRATRRRIRNGLLFCIGAITAIALLML